MPGGKKRSRQHPTNRASAGGGPGRGLLKAGAGVNRQPAVSFRKCSTRHFRWTRAVRLSSAGLHCGPPSYPSLGCPPCTTSSYVAAVMAVLVIGCGIVLLALASR